MLRNWPYNFIRCHTCTLQCFECAYFGHHHIKKSLWPPPPTVFDSCSLFYLHNLNRTPQCEQSADGIALSVKNTMYDTLIGRLVQLVVVYSSKCMPLVQVSDKYVLL